MRIGHRLYETVWVAAFTGRSSTGDPTYAAAASRPARIDRETLTIRTAEGREVEVGTTVWTETPIGIADRVWLPAIDGTAPNTSDVNAAKTPAHYVEDRSLTGQVVAYRTFL